ncbi:MAG: hypothetical protein HQK62_11970 [Desulfamplus sp.]|nr:hypothetical protein [Desulfamplus sp.]MBF0259537.1 hypothetical protein [Desulfamplus sp.]
MKKKPSLLDIEMFVQKRTDEKQKELSKIEADSNALVFESLDLQPVPVTTPDSAQSTVTTTSRSYVETEKEVEKSGSAEDRTTAAYSSIKTVEPHTTVESNTAQTAELNPINIVDERLTSIIEITDLQRDEISKLKQDMFKLKEQLRVYHSFLSNQQKKISDLEKSLSELSLPGKHQPYESGNKGVIDANYAKLLLKNIVWLKEEKDFSSNDVARLFRAEGFDTPQPHQGWDEKVINIMYSEAKRSFL